MNQRAKTSRTKVSMASLGLCLGLWAAFAPAANAGSDGRGIMEQVAQTRKLDGSEAVLKMSIIDKGGHARVRKLSMASKLFDAGKTEKRIYRFLEPADIKGTGVLVYDYEAKADDVWIYLPALRKSRRIVSSERSKSFMGSEFSYGDLNIPVLSEYDYKVVKEEQYAGESCYVIDETPKSDSAAKADGYKKKTYWVSKSTHSVRKIDYLDLDGQLLKQLTAENIKLLDAAKKRYRAMRLEMVNRQNGRRSVFESEKVALTPNTKDEYFTTRYLERP